MNQHIEKIRFLEHQLRESNKKNAWWEDMLLHGNILFTGELKEA